MKTIHRILDPGVPDPSAGGRCALAVMTKAPRAGQVKTRLAPPLTSDEAAKLNVCFLRDTTATIAEATAEIGRRVAVYTPVGAEEAYVDILPSSFDLVPQRGDKFGERLACATYDLFQLGFQSICLIDSDSPTVPAKVYAEAARLLSNTGDRIVVGPADDGGYYLIGMKQNHRRLFEGIDWSTERVLDQTIHAAAELNLPVELLPTFYDVDDGATLRRLCDELLGQYVNVDVAPETRKFLGEIIRCEGRNRIWPAL
jgi:rSAM/selenodomain-associated transferase 1